MEPPGADAQRNLETLALLLVNMRERMEKPSGSTVGGGNATAAGMRFQAQLGAFFCADLLSERELDARVGLGSSKIRSIRFETEAPVDDVMLETEDEGIVAIQAKTRLDLSTTRASPFGSAVEQMARFWAASRQGTAQRGWQRAMDPSRDRLLLAVGSGSSTPITGHLRSALEVTGATRNKAQASAVETLLGHARECWQRLGQTLSSEEEDAFLSVIRVVSFDFDGADGRIASDVLRDVVESPESARSAFENLTSICLTLMQERSGFDGTGARVVLANSGIRLRAAPSYQHDVELLRNYSSRTARQLSSYEKLQVGAESISIERSKTSEIVRAAEQGSLLVIGEPGVGKSGVLNAVVRALTESGRTALLLAVDQLPVSSLDGLRTELGLQHSFADVLTNWPIGPTAYLVIDALDATRGGPSEAVFKALVSRVVGDLPGRWNVIASIRTFDLRMGTAFRTHFAGAAPLHELSNAEFKDTRHIEISTWTDEEHADILRRAPALARALASATPRLADLSRVPFNTRLLLDLVSNTAPDEPFGALTSQAEILSRYWAKRVSPHGSGAAVCMRALVESMLSSRSLQAPIEAVAAVSALALDALLHEGVIERSATGRSVRFRHHILFDYAASKHLLPLDDDGRLLDLFGRNEHASFALAPSLVFLLQDAWIAAGDVRASFWSTVTVLATSPRADPLATAVATRVAVELPSSKSDIAALRAMLSLSPESRETALRLIRHLVGSLAMRFEDEPALDTTAWRALVELLADHLDDTTAWPMRSLLYLLADRASDDPTMGAAARALLEHALAKPLPQPMLTAAAIGFVVTTYATAPAAAREILGRIISPPRFASRAAAEVPWLARQVEKLGDADPHFVSEIYRVVFSESIDDESITQIGGGTILPLTSTAKQDYESARYSLREYFRKFISREPALAAKTLVSLANRYAQTEHNVDTSRVHQLRSPASGGLIPDESAIWAAPPFDRDSDSVLGLLQGAQSLLESGNETDATAFCTALARSTAVAIVWSRLFLASARRPEILSEIAWPYASTESALTSVDTRKDAIDCIARAYPLRSESDRREFESQLLAWNLGSERDVLVRRVMSSIGLDHLVSEEAKSWANFPSPDIEEINPRPSRFRAEFSKPEPRWWLKDSGADLKSRRVTDALDAADEVVARFNLDKEGHSVVDAPSLLDALEELCRLVERNFVVGSDPAALFAYAHDAVARGCKCILGNSTALTLSADAIVGRTVALLNVLASSPAPAKTGTTEHDFARSPGWGSPAPRVDGAELAFRAYGEVFPTRAADTVLIRRLVDDEHPAVRHQAVSSFFSFWKSDRQLFWKLVDDCIDRERNRGVLRALGGHILARLVHAAPDEVAPRVIRLLELAPTLDGKTDDTFYRHLAQTLALLWISHEHRDAKTVLDSWIVGLEMFDGPLEAALGAARGGLALAYDDESDATKANVGIRQRSQTLVGEALAASASALESAQALARPGQINDENVSLAKLLDRATMQFCYAARHQGDSEAPQLSSARGKAAYLEDVAPWLRRAGDIALPGTIYHLVEFFEGMLSSSPALAFDLLAHTLLTSGRVYGYQTESLGADAVVRVVGRCLADYRPIFDDMKRRDQLVGCLDAFVQAGWPSARRLLYQLPALLQ